MFLLVLKIDYFKWGSKIYKLFGFEYQQHQIRRVQLTLKLVFSYLKLDCPNLFKNYYLLWASTHIRYYPSWLSSHLFMFMVKKLKYLFVNRWLECSLLLLLRSLINSILPANIFPIILKAGTTKLTRGEVKH